jgi:hypothetical protein
MAPPGETDMATMNHSALQPLPVEQVQHPNARWLLAYWRTKSPDGHLPAYASFSQHETRAIAPHLIVVKGAGDSLRYERAGWAVVDRFRLDLAGLPLPPESTGGWSAMIRQAASEQRPAAGRGHLPGSQGDWVRFEIVALPFADEAGDNSIVVAGLFFFGP